MLDPLAGPLEGFGACSFVRGGVGKPVWARNDMFGLVDADAHFGQQVRNRSATGCQTCAALFWSSWSKALRDHCHQRLLGHFAGRKEARDRSRMRSLASLRLSLPASSAARARESAVSPRVPATPFSSAARAREPLPQVACSPDAVAAFGANQAVGTGRDDQLQDAFANGARKSAWPPFAASALISKSVLGHADLRRHR